MGSPADPGAGGAGATTTLQAWAGTGKLGLSQQETQLMQQQQGPAPLMVQDWRCPALLRLVRQVAEGREARSGCTR